MAATTMPNPTCGERMAPKGTGQGAGQGAADAHDAERALSRQGFDGGGGSAESFGALAGHRARQYSDWTACCLSPDMKLPSLMRLKETRRVPMWSGHHRPVRPSWAKLFKRVFEIDLEHGPNCGGELKIERANPARATNISDIPMARRWAHWRTFGDWVRRRTLSSRLSTRMDMSFCLGALDEALVKYGQREIVLSLTRAAEPLNGGGGAPLPPASPAGINSRSPG